MKYVFSILLFLLISSYNSIAQNRVNSEIVDSSYIVCKYRQLHIKDPNIPVNISENTMILQIGKSIAIYVDEKKLAYANLIQKYEKDRINIESKTAEILAILRGSEREELYKNYPKGRITTKTNLLGSYIYEEDLVKPQWSLVKGNINVLGYKCNKAITNFRGRSYTAWYCSEVSISQGPWKFWGLPGLIMKIEDDKNEISMECISLEKKVEPIFRYHKSSKTIITDKDKFSKLLKDYMENPSPYLKSSGLITTELPTRPREKRPYNPIELND